MHPIQIVIVCFALFALTRVVGRFRRGGMERFNLWLWLLFWSGVIVVAVLPDTTSIVAAWLGVGRGADIAMYLGLMSAFYVLFRILGKVEDLDRQITRVVRAAALKDLDELVRAERAGTAAAPDSEARRDPKTP